MVSGDSLSIPWKGISPPLCLNIKFYVSLFGFKLGRGANVTAPHKELKENIMMIILGIGIGFMEGVGHAFPLP